MSRSSSAGNYTRSIETPTDPFNDRVMAFKNGNTDPINESDDPETWSADKVKAAALMFERADQAKIDANETTLIGTAWTKEHPEYVDNDSNAYLMRHQLRSNGVIRRAANVEDFDLAYEQLRQSNLLKLDQTVVNAQNIQAAKQLAAAQRAQNTLPTEQEMYDMPLDDLRTLDALHNQGNKQRIAEEGGW